MMKNIVPVLYRMSFLGIAICVNIAASQDSATQNSALFQAIENNNPEQVRQALRSGANHDAVNNHGIIVLAKAIGFFDVSDTVQEDEVLDDLKRRRDIIFILLDAGANPNKVSVSWEEISLIQLFCFDESMPFFKYHAQVAEKLLQKGANPNLSDADEYTPLRFLAEKYMGFKDDTLYNMAAKNFIADMVKLLMRHGANAYAQNSGKESAYSIATSLIKQVEKDLATEQVATLALQELLTKQTQAHNPKSMDVFPGDVGVRVMGLLRKPTLAQQ